MKKLKKLTLLITLLSTVLISGCTNEIKNNTNSYNNSIITNSSSENKTDMNDNDITNIVNDTMEVNTEESTDENTSNESIESPENNSSEETLNTTENKTIEEEKTAVEDELLLPEGFVYVKDIIPNIVEEMRYSTENNFTGRIVDGYYDNTAILTTDSCEALKKVQDELSSQELGLKIFDAYRPQKAVDCFVSWSNDYSDTLMKDEYYPEVAKKDIIPSGYIARKSSHSKGSTVDLTIINLETKEELDMGSNFDFFGVQSHFYYEGLTSSQLENRELLKSTMEKYGFKYYKNEWWHYTYVNQPFPSTYFDFDVK